MAIRKKSNWANIPSNGANTTFAWTAHKPQDCTLNPKHTDYKGKKSDHKANSAVVASLATVPSATTTLNNRYVALLAMLATMNEEE